MSTSTAQQKSADRLAYVDGLRGIAILMVILTHTWVATGCPALSFFIGQTPIVLAAVPAVGNIGVNLFLVISGFCLAWPFMRDLHYRERMTVGQFWKRRIKRIVPAYYFSIFAVLIFDLAAGLLLRNLPPSMLAGKTSIFGTLPPLSELWPHLFLVHNLSLEHVSTINGSYWSMALEFQLYFFFPLLFELFFRWGPWRTLTLVLCVQVAYRFLLEHTLTPVMLDEYQFVLVKSVFGRVLDFYLGMTAAYLLSAKAIQFRPLLGRAALFVSVSLLVAAFILFYRQTASAMVLDLLWGFGFASLICCAAQDGTQINRLFCWKPLAQLGYMSYSIYLIHQPLTEFAGFLLQLFLKPGLAFFAGLLCIPLTIMIGAFFFRFFEAPFLNKPVKNARGDLLSPSQKSSSPSAVPIAPQI